jgi:hypothetical protein
LDRDRSRSGHAPSRNETGSRLVTRGCSFITSRRARITARDETVPPRDELSRAGPAVAPDANDRRHHLVTRSDGRSLAMPVVSG